MSTSPSTRSRVASQLAIAAAARDRPDVTSLEFDPRMGVGRRGAFLQPDHEFRRITLRPEEAIQHHAANQATWPPRSDVKRAGNGSAHEWHRIAVARDGRSDRGGRCRETGTPQRELNLRRDQPHLHVQPRLARECQRAIGRRWPIVRRACHAGMVACGGRARHLIAAPAERLSVPQCLGSDPRAPEVGGPG